MTVISVRVNDAVKERMNELKHINWSEIIREEIIRILKREDRRDLAKALLMNEDLRRDARRDSIAPR
jgi:predicted transcriptional regulator